MLLTSLGIAPSAKILSLAVGNSGGDRHPDQSKRKRVVVSFYSIAPYDFLRLAREIVAKP